jgi:hypothetical protein
MQLSHSPQLVSAAFDDPNLVSCAGLAPVVALAHRCGLAELVADKLTLPAKGGVNAHLKIPALIGGMVAGADSIDDMDLLRHGGTGRLFGGVRAPSTLGTFLRTFTFGHVRQLDSVASSMLAELAARTPLLAGVGQVAYVDVDDTVKATYGYAKQGAGYGYSGVKGLNALIATVSTPLSAPVICATRLRKGSTNSARGAGRLVADALVAAKAAGAGGPDGKGLIVLRADSAFYNHDVVAAARRGGVRYSITARMSPALNTAISSISEDNWTPITYPNAVWDDQEQRLISDAEIAEIPYTAFTSRRKADHIEARLIVRRVKRLNPTLIKPKTTKTTPKATAEAPSEATTKGKQSTAEQQELFSLYRYHAVFSDSPLILVQAEKAHRGHAIIEQVNADLKNGPLAHLPSGSFQANSAWLVMAAIAFNLTRAAGCLASAFHARATTGTIRAQLINVPARLAHSARKLRLHLPTNWPWEPAWTQLFDATLGPPTVA